MKQILYCIALLIWSCSCNKEAGVALEGGYTEVTPHAGRTILFFSGGMMTMQIKGGNSVPLHYKIRGTQIELTQPEAPGYTTTLTFKYIDDTHFEIGDLYPANGVNAPATMTFQK